ncbi:MAG: serine/threonine-protein kinase [Vicinamibacterales bacterium]
MSCTRCGAAVPAGSRFCPACGHSTSAAAVVTAGDDQTRLASTPHLSPTSDSGWLHSSGSIDHGRFAPGAILDNRYRILGLAGRGGMGEVYRAEDLRLGQPVALKFLPEPLAGDPVRLAQFHNEVRTARQVSHPNVCRVYDIGEMNGQLFITMEYVDGEDLSSLLRRIGRVPEDKGLDIARQICAGLAAAHERGVLHRDLKPANIMLDGSGKVRIMDFSLAAVGEVQDIRAGTPAYMAPEQLSGQDVTVRSDIYALGLVLYEIFTGRRVFDAKNLSDLIEQHRDGTLAAPTALVRGLDPAIEAAILRCLEPEPARRPASAIAVSAALPGGDPLAAALAAGETPSPEMVAAAGGDHAAMSTASGVVWLAVAAGLVLACAWVSGRTSLLARVPLTKPAAVLADRSETLRESFGYTEPFADRAYGFQYDTSYLGWADAHGSGRTHWAELPSGTPPVVRFWYRTSPTPIVPRDSGATINTSDPPIVIHGMTMTVIDTSGRLQWFTAAPPQKETAQSGPVRRVDWTPFLDAAGFDVHSLTESSPRWTPPSYADERRSWSATLPGTSTPITIEASGYRGRAVDFKVIGPWNQPGREPAPGPARRQGTNAYVIYVLLAGAAGAAYRQVRRGRADLRGAFTIAAFTTLLYTAIWAASRHVNDVNAEQERLFLQIGMGMFVGGAMYILYVGLEPFVRRAWPSMLVGWTRLLSGRVRDPIIGRDVLLGIACGAGFSLLNLAGDRLQMMVGLPEPIPHLPEFGPLLGARDYLVTLLGALNNGMQNTLITVFEFSVFRWLFEWAARRSLEWSAGRWPRTAAWKMTDRTSERVFVALAIATVAIVSAIGNGSTSQRFADALINAVSLNIALLLLIRIGIFASAIMFVVNSVVLRMPLTLDGNALYAGAGWFTLVWLLALAWVGFRMATTSAHASRVGAPVRVE